MLLHSDLDLMTRLSGAETLFTALDNVRDIVQITDAQDRLIYGNAACEKLLGYNREDIQQQQQSGAKATSPAGMGIWDLQSTGVGQSDMSLPENNVVRSVNQVSGIK